MLALAFEPIQGTSGHQEAVPSVTGEQMTIIIPWDRSKLSRKGGNFTAVSWTHLCTGRTLAATSTAPGTQGSQMGRRVGLAPACHTKSPAKPQRQGSGAQEEDQAVQIPSHPLQNKNKDLKASESWKGNEAGRKETPWMPAPCAYGCKHNRPRVLLPRGTERKLGLSCTWKQANPCPPACAPQTPGPQRVPRSLRIQRGASPASN